MLDLSGFGGSTGNESINLRKGDKLNLRKNDKPLTKIMVGLGWQASDRRGEDFDLDASVFMLGSTDKVPRPQNVVFFNNLNSPCGSVKHMGDDLKGGDGIEDSEQIEIDLTAIPQNIEKLVFSVTIYDANARRQNFGQVTNAFIRVVDQEGGKELLRYDLTEDYSSDTAVLAGEISREGSGWKFRALGQGLKEEIDGVCKMYGAI